MKMSLPDICFSQFRLLCPMLHLSKTDETDTKLFHIKGYINHGIVIDDWLNWLHNDCNYSSSESASGKVRSRLMDYLFYWLHDKNVSLRESASGLDM